MRVFDNLEKFQKVETITQHLKHLKCIVGKIGVHNIFVNPELR